jgi:hypothetical protein
MMRAQRLDLRLPTRDGETVEVAAAGFTREGVAEVVIINPTTGGYSVCGTVITAKQARILADAFDELARFWGE